MNSKLILHVGHGKTGTSYIQSTLALNVEKLRENGIAYPKHLSLELAAKGITTSGNGSLIFDRNFCVNGITLLSDEGFCYRLTVDNNFEKLVLRHKSELEVILYTRNVIEFYASSWGQYIKTGLGTLDFEQYILERDQHPYELILWWLETAKKHDFVCKVRNYSNHKHALMEIFTQDLLGDSLDVDLQLPANNIINRSLTISELNALTAFNRYLGKDESFIAKNLVHKLPDIEPEYPKISQQSYHLLNNRIQSSIQKINALIDPKEAVLIEDFHTYNSKTNVVSSHICELSKDQLSVIAEAISDELTFNSLVRRKSKKYMEMIRRKLKKTIWR